MKRQPFYMREWWPVAGMMIGVVIGLIIAAST